jgi:hypothetical protein
LSRLYFTAIERCAGEVVTEILEVAENYDIEEGQLQLAMHGATIKLSYSLHSYLDYFYYFHPEFPAFTNLFRQMKEADSEYASKCLSHWKQFIKGPPNRPNYDENGLLQVRLFFHISCFTHFE